MYQRFVPYTIIKQRQRQFIATVLIITLVLSVTYYLFSSQVVSATTTYTWNDAVTLDRAIYTDTTRDHFLGGYPLSDGYVSFAVTEVDDGEVTLNQDWSYRYNVSTDPPLASDYVYQSFLDTNNNLLYAGTNGGGLSVINMQVPTNPGDDTLLFNYDFGSTPSINSDYVYHTLVSNGQLYVSTDDGLSVINLQGSTDPSDDTLGIHYHTGSSPALASDSVFHLFISENNLYYVSTSNGLSVINMQGTVDPGDDVLVTNYNTGSTPALASNAVVHAFQNNNLLYISTSESGLYVINTQGTIDPGDDTLVTRYYTGSSLALDSDYVNHAFFDNNLLYLSTYGGGLYVINTQGTIDPGDDVLVTNYDTSSTPALEGSDDETFYSFISNNHLYISTNGGLYVINTQGTIDPSDDTLVTRYYTDSIPGLASNSVFHAFINNNRIYVSTAGGISVINISEEYNPSTTFLSLPQSLSTTPTTSLSIDIDNGDGQDVSLAYRVGSSDVVWRDDFATTSSYAGDFYSWGYEFEDDSVTDGILQLSNPPSGDGGTWGAYASFNTGYIDDYFPAGSIITARVRANITDPERDFSAFMFADEWDGADVLATTTNEWTTLTLVADTDFSTVGFEISLPDEFGWESIDNFQVDWIQITNTDSDAWDDWSSDCTNSVCPIDPGDLIENGWIQYRLDLATDNLLLTPKVLSVTYQGDYVTLDTYTGTTETFDSTQSLLNFDVTADIPTDTSITYEYSTDNATTWIPITPGTTINQTATNFTWRATLSTTDPTVTPTITLVTLSTIEVNSSTSGTSIAKRIALLEATGKLEEAATLRQQHPQLFTSGTALELQWEIVLKAKELVILLEKLMKLREGE